MATKRRTRRITVDAAALMRVADRRVPALRRAIVDALDAGYRSVTNEEAYAALTHSTHASTSIVDWHVVARRMGAPDGTYTLRKAASDTAADLFGTIYNDAAGMTGSYLGGRLDLTNQHAVDYGSTRAGELIVGFQREQIDVVRDLTSRAMAEGIDPRSMGRMLRSSVGLSPRQARALANYESGLRERLATGRTSTVLRGNGRPLATQRVAWDKLSEERVDKLVDDYRTRLINYRAETIARTEAARAANMGSLAELTAAADAGMFDKRLVSRVWMTADDDRLCPECAAMDGMSIEFEGTFDSVDDDDNIVASVETPPLHPNCRCSFTTDISDDALASAFADNVENDRVIWDDLTGQTPSPAPRGEKPSKPSTSKPKRTPRSPKPKPVMDTATPPRITKPPVTVEAPPVAMPEPAPATIVADTPVTLPDAGTDHWGWAAERAPSDVIAFADDATEAMFRETLNAIDHLHGLPVSDVVDIAVEFRTEPMLDGAFGGFSSGGISGWDPTYTKTARGRIGVSGVSDHPQMTFAHEFGHAMDNIDFGEANRFWVEEAAADALANGATDDANFQFVRWAANDPHTKRVVSSAARRRSVTGAGRDYAEYWSSTREVWARAYAQYVAEVGGQYNPALAAELRSMYAAGADDVWPKSVFDEKVRPMVEGVLRERGLLVD